MKYTEDDKRLIADLWLICTYFRKKYNLTDEAKDQIVDEFYKSEEFLRALEKCDFLIKLGREWIFEE